MIIISYDEIIMDCVKMIINVMMVMVVLVAVSVMKLSQQNRTNTKSNNDNALLLFFSPHRDSMKAKTSYNYTHKHTDIDSINTKSCFLACFMTSRKQFLFNVNIVINGTVSEI